jgi:AcrR family transcriptional regulator
MKREGAELSRRERRKLEVRIRILRAGVALFELHGIEATTVAAICERADIAQKTFFNHFPSKRHLLRDLAHYALGQLLSEIEEACKQPVSTRERIQHFFECVARNADGAGPMRRELISEIVHVSYETGSGQEHARQLHDAFNAIVREGLVLGDVTVKHSQETLTEMLMGAYYVLMFDWAHLDDYPLRERALATARFLADSLTVPKEEQRR